VTLCHCFLTRSQNYDYTTITGVRTTITLSTITLHIFSWAKIHFFPFFSECQTSRLNYYTTIPHYDYTTTLHDYTTMTLHVSCSWESYSPYRVSLFLTPHHPTECHLYSLLCDSTSFHLHLIEITKNRLHISKHKNHNFSRTQNCLALLLQVMMPLLLSIL
jgi:hypothetical protein